MARSRKYNPAGGWAAGSPSEAAWKAEHSRRRRRRIREQLRVDVVAGHDVDPWVPDGAEGHGPKDGKTWYRNPSRRMVGK